MKASNTGANDQLGMSVALSGDGNTLAVSAHREDGSGTGVNAASNEAANDAGAVYVFAKVAGSWSQEAYVKASDTAANDTFGSSVALSSDGNTLAVGARGKAGGRGAAYVFTRTGGIWAQQAVVAGSNADPNGLFGVALALSGDGNTLAVGAAYLPLRRSVRLRSQRRSLAATGLREGFEHRNDGHIRKRRRIER